MGGSWADYPIYIATDIVQSPNPLLYPRNSLAGMKAKICFDSNILFLPESREIPLLVESPGRLSIPFDVKSAKIPNPKSRVESIWFVDPKPTIRVPSPDKLKKLHISLVRGTVASVSKILTLAGYYVDRQKIPSLISACGCDQSRAVIGKQKSQRRVPICPGRAAFLDIAYLKENDAHRSPFLLMVDAFSRFAICKLL